MSVWPSSPFGPIQADMSLLTCQADLFRLAYSCYPAQIVLSRLSYPRFPVMAVLPWLSCLIVLYQLSLPVMVWPFCPGWPLLADLSCQQVQADLSQLSCRGCPVPDVLFRLCCHGCPATVFYVLVSCPRCCVLDILLFLSCHDYLFMANVLSCPRTLVLSSPAPAILLAVMFRLSFLSVKYPLSCPGCPVINVMSLLSCSGRSVLSVLSKMTCPGCIVPAVLSRLSDPGCPVLAVPSGLSCAGCPVPGVLSCLSCNENSLLFVLSGYLSWLACQVDLSLQSCPS